MRASRVEGQRIWRRWGRQAQEAIHRCSLLISRQLQVGLRFIWGWGGGHRVENIEQNFPSPPAKGRSPHQADGAGLWVLHPQRLFSCPGLWRLRRGVVLVFEVTHGASPSQARMCQSREEAASLGMTLSNFIEAKAPEDSKRAGEKLVACPSFSLLSLAPGLFKKTREKLSSW